MKSSICREDVRSVIKPDNFVFLGHDIKGWQFSANAQEMVAERAIKCAQEPAIQFDYDYR